MDFVIRKEVVMRISARDILAAIVSMTETGVRLDLPADSKFEVGKYFEFSVEISHGQRYDAWDNDPPEIIIYGFYETPSTEYGV